MKRFRPEPDSQPVQKLTLFGPPPLFEGEDSAAYDGLLAQVSGTIKPKDVIEEIWTHDFVDITWEIRQLRRAKMVLVENGIAAALEAALLPSFNPKREPWYPEELKELVGNWTAGDQAATNKVEKLLAAAKLTKNKISYSAFLNKIHTIEQLDRLIAASESRRNAILREIERHRASVADALQKEIIEAEEANFQTLAAQVSKKSDQADAA
jgi:hypothetical protein